MSYYYTSQNTAINSPSSFNDGIIINPSSQYTKKRLQQQLENRIPRNTSHISSSGGGGGDDDDLLFSMELQQPVNETSYILNSNAINYSLNSESPFFSNSLLDSNYNFDPAQQNYKIWLSTV
ncbi:hypothetical protein Kpol_1018p27 [Vanderwaltozyma polyspora DSM 70294]|uniref:Uncharacterized protein n=1 Tax=Vanderwaltozyma polyspora (strain ATCC 22028 / DSM 70294 / BCRC 21397 / CBS 2163 / NBRC 10782 / NRRL Y-8283 / UCD 57-17) TaxID=436907 RepID=A7TDM9_VANPO|nr:uncharacterized protein Kpol_1018p27 [Vanderwaltozyma polyspora DSM 70294]EDO19499.1 hypothetical protein Kpol_1018p27 [Vanderwaltozyma polyspora DSM 70294]